MKKIYLPLVLTIVFLSVFGISRAAVYTTTASGGTRNFSDAATWTGGIVPPNPCNLCSVIITAAVTFDVLDQVFNNSLIEIRPSVVVDINNWIELNNTQVILDNGTVLNQTTLNVNDEVDLFGSNITIGGSNAMIDANNFISNTTHGPIIVPGNVAGDPGNAGIYYSLSGSPIENNYDMVLNQIAFGGPFPVPGTDALPEYDINCTIGGPPNQCVSGRIYGPADIEDQTLNGFGHNAFQFATTLPLPVILARIAAILNPDNTVNIIWSTVEEVNSDYFGVERSTDAMNWQTLGSIGAKGHSSGIVDYAFKDGAPFKAMVNYYRLKMVDLDAKFNYSKIVKVALDGKPPSLVVYNNPFHDQVRIKINLDVPETLDLKLTDMLGRTFNQQSFKAQSGDNFINISPASGSSGLYVLTIKGQKFNQSVKLVKE